MRLICCPATARQTTGCCLLAARGRYCTQTKLNVQRQNRTKQCRYVARTTRLEYMETIALFTTHFYQSNLCYCPIVPGILAVWSIEWSTEWVLVSEFAWNLDFTELSRIILREGFYSTLLDSCFTSVPHIDNGYNGRTYVHIARRSSLVATHPSTNRGRSVLTSPS